jgi:pectinesterase
MAVEECKSKKSKMRSLKLYTTLLVLLFAITAMAQKRIVVSQDGKGDFKTIQGAINSLSDSASVARVILIKNGIYKEKIYIEKHNIVLQGEDREKTVISQSIPRDEWRCEHMDDWGVATMNVDGNDITLKNLSVINSYGFENDKEVTLPCKNDTVTHTKKIAKNGHQMALRTIRGTRLSAINCHFSAFGGDTVSPWDINNGMFYFKDCIMEGGVDFYCPRGWAYAENCKFISHSGTAAIWHDGSKWEDSKTVLVNCKFEGFDNFNLGRYHRDAQFYLINCKFAANMADKDIYLVPTANAILWGRRVYYSNCHREGGKDFSWYADNVETAKGSPKPKDINVKWVFGNRWNPTNEK